MIRIGICGACGKMGTKIASLALLDREIEIKGAFERKDHPMTGRDLGESLEKKKLGVNILSSIRDLKTTVDCVIDFTSPESTIENAIICSSINTALVIGTTGIDRKGEKKIEEAAKKIAIVYSPNMAVGVNILFRLINEAAAVLGKDCAINIDETHHVHKKDAPSGTAKKMAEIASYASGVEPQVKSIREGEVIGNHGIVFDTKYETIEIRHNAKSRDVFASGALKAAKFAAGRQKGLYNMFDVLGL